MYTVAIPRTILDLLLLFQRRHERIQLCPRSALPRFSILHSSNSLAILYRVALELRAQLMGSQNRLHKPLPRLLDHFTTCCTRIIGVYQSCFDAP